MTGAPMIRVPKLHQIRIEQNGPRIALILDGRLVFDAEWQEALRVGQGLIERAMAARAEAQQKANGQPRS